MTVCIPVVKEEVPSRYDHDTDEFDDSRKDVRVDKVMDFYAWDDVVVSAFDVEEGGELMVALC